VRHEVRIRLATADDIETIARQRAAMFAEMGTLSSEMVAEMHAAAVDHLRVSLPSREYIGWLAYAADDPLDIVGGAGVQRRRTLPFPRQLPDGSTCVARGRQAIVLNVYTETAWRRRGVARQLMASVLQWARDDGVESLVLHASPDGRPLYEQLGFVATNEMRFMGELGGADLPTR
jgi:GNAT superfamily N-acetyltransferase